MVSHVPEQTKRSMASYCQEDDTDVLRSFELQYYCAEPFLKGDLSNESNQTISFSEYTTDKDKSLFVLFWHATSCLIGLFGTMEIKKLIFVNLQNFRQKTSRT